MPPCKRIKRLERELREVRTKFVEKDIELNQVKLVATEHLNSAIIDIREQAKVLFKNLRRSFLKQTTVSKKIFLSVIILNSRRGESN